MSYFLFIFYYIFFLCTVFCIVFGASIDLISAYYFSFCDFWVDSEVRALISFMLVGGFHRFVGLRMQLSIFLETALAAVPLRKSFASRNQHNTHRGL